MALQAINLRVNLRVKPLGIDTAKPEFSWQLTSDERSIWQTGYQIQVAVVESFALTPDPLWDSGIISSDIPWGAIYSGVPLISCCQYFWRVRVRDHNQQVGPWSPPSWFETAFLEGSKTPDAQWITREIRPSKPQSKDRDVLYFCRELHLPSSVRRARLYATSLGWYKFFLNDVNITGREQVPRWTPYHHHIEYQSYDVTALLRSGENHMGAIVADGHFRGENGGLSKRNCYGDRLALFCLLTIELETGQQIECRTDTSWTVTTGRIVRADPKAGELVDFRICEAWRTGETDTVGRPDREAVDLLPSPTKSLISEETEKVEDIGRLVAKRIWWSPAGKMLVDLGQNFAGHVRVKLQGPQGRAVTLTYSEVLTPEGELDIDYIEPVGKGRPQRDQAILSGSGTDWFEPMFTLHGFRYVEITGLDDLLSTSDIEGVVISSQLGPTAKFHCSDSRLEKLYQNTLWSFWSNFIDTPTDCPTREQSGWTGDLQVFAPTAMLLARDVQSYLRRYLRNLSKEQWTDGRIPPFIPSGDSEFAGTSWLSRMTASSVGWGDVSVILPWKMFEHFADKTILERQYASMKLWVNFLERTARTGRSWRRWLWGGPAEHEQYIVDTGFHWGEWLRPGETGLVPMLANLFLWPSPAVPTAYLAESSRLLSETARTLGHDQDAAYYHQLSGNVSTAWRKSFVRSSGSRIGQDKQDDYVRAIKFGLVSGPEKQAALARLVELVHQTDYHIGTGFLTTGDLVGTLCDNGYGDEAFRLLLQTTPPSWLYAVEREATTIWESWEGYTSSGRASLSHNHYALGAVTGWLISGLVGVNKASPGWRHIRIAPRIGGGITHAEAKVEIPFGQLFCSWTCEDGSEDVMMQVQIPAGTTADVQIGDSAAYSIGSGHHKLCWSKEGWITVDGFDSG